MADCRAVVALFDEVWQVGPAGGSELPPALVRVWAHTGGYVVGAYDGPDLIAASVAFLSDRPLRSLHSHITGVRAGALGRGVGALLKRHQRDWARDRGIDTITWTFDPLIARNAHFNLVRLGARPVEYLPDFYGDMPDGRNAGQPSDRLFVHWSTAIDPAVPETRSVATGLDGSSDVDEASPVLDQAGDGGPRIRPDAGARRVRLAVPTDVEALRVRDPGAALAWRLALRDTLEPELAAGHAVTFCRGVGYLVDRQPGGPG